MTKDTLKQLIELLRLLGISYSDGDIEIQDLGVPHQPPKRLPEGKMAVYSFFYNGRAIKVGRSGASSGSRYTSQHYNSNSSRSNLAASLEAKPGKLGLTKLDVKDSNSWLKHNTQRVNFLVNIDLGIEVLNLIEAFLIAKFSPVYEGFDTQRRK